MNWLTTLRITSMTCINNQLESRLINHRKTIRKRRAGCEAASAELLAVCKHNTAYSRCGRGHRVGEGQHRRAGAGRESSLPQTCLRSLRRAPSLPSATACVTASPHRQQQRLTATRGRSHQEGRPPKVEGKKTPRIVDATKETASMGRLINHSKPELPNQITTSTAPHLILKVSRDIDEGEELLYDYGDRSKASIAAHLRAQILITEGPQKHKTRTEKERETHSITLRFPASIVYKMP
ncbi:N-lysine methyltransferase KMT5A-A-like isoform X1 [Lates japonicus]|uniref:N-lysine methyltransferase KMT5A-A-like isoform X1 n=1 Tax=Lates japonicus TaxID=270547 RepID=A0AAD3NFV6_LATJO|nr:N-lysine methyltransferase KMT5A-A-like isoform X1 [Lates japonicus]